MTVSDEVFISRVRFALRAAGAMTSRTRETATLHPLVSAGRSYALQQ